MNFNPIKIVETTSRTIKAYVQVCPNCQCERFITYPQAWNLKKGNSAKQCVTCRIELGLQTPNLKGLELGRKRWPESPGVRKNKGTYFQNIFRSDESKARARIKQSLAKKGKCGPKANNWQHGKTKENRRLRNHPIYKAFRDVMLNLFKYSCSGCGNQELLHVHHFKKWSEFPKLRMKKSNCTVLCKKCHMELHHG